MNRASAIGLLLVVTIAAGCASPGAGSSGTWASGFTTTLPDDVVAVAHITPATAADVAQATVPVSEAWVTARAGGATWPNGSVYLARLSQFGNDTHGVPIENRLIWLFRFTGISFTGPVPYTSPQITAPPFTRAYYFVDARSDEFLGSSLAGAP